MNTTAEFLILLARTVLLIKIKKIRILSKYLNFVKIIMILFLDAVSPLPEFSLIEDNKIIYSKKILQNIDEKMSDCIIPTYLSMEKKFFLSGKLTLLITNIGPGSYTSLRIGIAFLSGLALSYKIDVLGLSCLKLFSYAIDDKDFHSTGIIIASSNNQNYIFLYDTEKDQYIINRIDENNLFIKKNILKTKKILTNDEVLTNQFNIFKNIINKKILFDELVVSNLEKIISLPRKNIIKPIYFSDNKILN